MGATSVGKFPCILVYAIEDFPELCSPQIMPVRLKQEFFPTEEFCTEKYEFLWGWRRTNIHKTFAMRSLLRRGYDVFFSDADNVFFEDPFPTCIFNIAKQPGVDVIAKRDAWYLNFGLAWIRSTPATIAMAARVY